MAVVKKTLFPENLERYNVFVEDTNPSSEYFKITELSDTFTGGKNAFLIAGSEYLVADTLLKIEIKDSQGNVVYHEPGEGIVSSSVGGTEIVTEYYEGISKVVAVHIYPDTAYGPATITILGELSSYNNNGLITPIPTQWEGQYNVKWQKQINVNPALANTTKIRFYRRPQATITETLSPIYTFSNGVKVESNIVSSFANIKISQMETFAGDVKRIKVFRTSLGDISDSDLIQDILVESKELLSTYELSGSVVGNGGLFTSETLEKLWISDGVTTELTSSRIDNGVKLNGAGKFKYSSSLNLSDVSVYELGLDAFYSASSESDLEIYISGSNNGEYLIGTLNGITPTKNLKDQIIQFSLPKAEPTASLYFSQSQSEWHLGNVSLKLTQDSAFSPSEIEFVTSMPTVIGNETYEFNFEFYDVNNNYVPVAVTQSALFTGGNNNLGGTLIFISASQSSSLAELQAVSSSISGTIVITSGSISGSLTNVSSSVSGTIVTLSGSVSSSITSLSSSVSASNVLILSSSLSKVQQLANGQFSGSFIGDTVIYSPAIGGQVGYIKELFTVGDTSAQQIKLDARTSTRKIYIGNGNYNNTDTSIYLDSGGQFSLKDKLNWDGSTLTVNGNINVTGGNAATQTYANTIGTNAVLSGSAAASLVDAKVFTNSAGLINKTPSASSSGLYLGSTYLGYYDGSNWKTYMANNGNFYLSGAGSDSLSWASGTLTINGSINITGGNAATTTQVNTAASNAVLSGSAAASAVDAKVFTDTSGKLSKTPSLSASGLYLGQTYMGYYNGSAWKTYMSNTGNFYLSGTGANGLSWDGTTLSINGNVVITGGATKDAIDAAASAASTAQTTANSKIGAADVNANVTSISGGAITTGTISANRLDVSGIISAGGIVVGGDGISRLSNNVGYQANGDAKTAGSVGGWSIGSAYIASNNGKVILYADGNMTLSDGGVEKIKITKDSLTKNNTSVSISIPGTSDGSGTDNYTHSYASQWTGYTQQSANSGTFTAQGSSIIVNVPYGGSTQSGLSGTVYWNNSLSGFKSIQNTTTQEITVKLFGSGGNLVDTKSVKVYNRLDILGTQQGYTFPYVPGGTTSVAFSGLSVGSNYYVEVVQAKTLSSVYYAWVFGVAQSAVWTYYGMQSAGSTVDITAAEEKTSIGVNGMIAASAGGFAQVGPVASVGGTAYSAAFLGNVRINGEVQASSFIATSDERLKTNIKDIESPLVTLQKLKPKSFIWNNKLAPFTDQKDSFGFIAQEVQKDFPYLVNNIGDNEEYDNVLSLDYNAIIPINTAAIKELLKKIEELEERILELENK